MQVLVTICHNGSSTQLSVYMHIYIYTKLQLRFSITGFAWSDCDSLSSDLWGAVDGVH